MNDTERVDGPQIRGDRVSESDQPVESVSGDTEQLPKQIYKSGPGYDQEVIESALASFGEVDDPLAILARYITKHSSRKMSDEASPVHAFMLKWSKILRQPILLEFSRGVMDLSGYVADPKAVTEMAKSISLVEALKGVNIVGGK